MQRQRGGLIPIGDALSGMAGPMKSIREASPQALHHFTLSDQVNALVGASEADLDLGFMARMLALCSLPRTNPGQRYRYVRRNGPYTLVMSATGINKLPYGNLLRLILAWVSTEAVRTQSRELILRSFAFRVHAGLGPGASRRCPHSAPQPDEAALQRSCFAGLRG